MDVYSYVSFTSSLHRKNASRSWPVRSPIRSRTLTMMKCLLLLQTRWWRPGAGEVGSVLKSTQRRMPSATSERLIQIALFSSTLFWICLSLLFSTRPDSGLCFHIFTHICFIIFDKNWHSQHIWLFIMWHFRIFSRKYYRVGCGFYLIRWKWWYYWLFSFSAPP